MQDVVSVRHSGFAHYEAINTAKWGKHPTVLSLTGKNKEWRKWKKQYKTWGYVCGKKST